MSDKIQCPKCHSMLQPKLIPTMNNSQPLLMSGTCKGCKTNLTFQAIPSIHDNYGNGNNSEAKRLPTAETSTLVSITPVSQISFEINGVEHVVANVDPTMTLNDYIRLQPGLTGTKKMCGEGGCGACVVAMTKQPENLTVAVNSCLRPLYSVDGYEIETTEGLGNRQEGLHPIQDRIAAYCGTQCGFCTSGMVMNMYSLAKSTPNPTMQLIEDSFDGNLCRCTGYRPILDAMKSFAVDSAGQQVRACQKSCPDIEDSSQCCKSNCEAARVPVRQLDTKQLASNNYPRPKKISRNMKEAQPFPTAWYSATTLKDAFDALKLNPAQSKLVVGNTSAGIFKNDNPVNLIDISRIPDLNLIDTTSSSTEITVGAAVSLSNLIATLRFQQIKSSPLGLLADHISHVANVPVRNVGCWAGNLMMTHNHANFPSDLFTILEGIGAKLKIASSTIVSNTYSLRDFLSLDMTQKMIISISIPFLPPTSVFQTFKIMPRHQNSHAYVNAAFNGSLDPSTFTFLDSPTIVFGGIGPYAVRATATEAFLKGKSLSDPSVFQGALSVLSNELAPDSPPASASPAYRKSLALSLFYKYTLHCLKQVISPRNQSVADPYVRPISSGSQTYDSDPTEYPVSKPLQKLEAGIQASGEAQYVDDIPMPSDGLHGAFVVSTVGNADIASIDAQAALQAPGVVAFFSAKDIPGENNFMFGGGAVEPIFAESAVSYAGQAIGLIVADTRAHAEAAVALVSVSYSNVKTPILTIAEAITAGNVQPSGIPAVVMGDVNSGFSKSDKVITGTVSCGSQYHFHMETQSTLIIPNDDGGFLVYSATQFIDNVQNVVASTLSIPASKVSVEVKRLGGAYGGKITRSNLPAAAVAVAANALRKPVRIAMSLNANMEVLGKRNPFMCNYKVGFNLDGSLQAVELDYYADCGCAPFDTTGTAFMAMTTCDNAYFAPNWQVNSFLCITNTPANTAARAPGCLPAIFFMETVVDAVARNLSMDPTAVREKNLYSTGKMTPYGQPVQYCSLNTVWPQMKQSSNYDARVQDVATYNAQNRWMKKGLTLMPLKYGIGWGAYACGATLNVYADGTVAVSHSGIEVGQGINTKIAQIAAYSLGIDMSLISIRSSSSEKIPNTAPTGGSITSELNGQAVIQACSELLARIAPVKSKNPDATWIQLVSLCIQQGIDLSTRAWLYPSTQYDFQYFSYGACCIEVQLDVLTGEVQILRCDIILDCGVSLNPLIDVGQVEGGFVMGLGYWLTEKIMYDEVTGQLLTNGTWEYKPPASKDIPIDFRISLLKNAPNPSGILRSKATGEPPSCMAACSIFAVKDAILAARKEIETDTQFIINAPLMVEDAQQLCLVDPSQFKF